MPWGRDADEVVWQEWAWTEKYQVFRDFVAGIEDNTEQTAKYLQWAAALASVGNEGWPAEKMQAVWRYSYMLENYLVNEWFKELYPCAVLGTFAYNGLYFVVQWEIWQVLLLLELEHSGGQHGVPSLIRKTAQWLASRLNHYTAVREVLMRLLKDHKG